jgi:hypothetical protein
MGGALIRFKKRIPPWYDASHYSGIANLAKLTACREP